MSFEVNVNSLFAFLKITKVNLVIGNSLIHCWPKSKFLDITFRLLIKKGWALENGKWTKEGTTKEIQIERRFTIDSKVQSFCLFVIKPDVSRTGFWSLIDGDSEMNYCVQLFKPSSYVYFQTVSFPLYLMYFIGWTNEEENIK